MRASLHTPRHGSADELFDDGYHSATYDATSILQQKLKCPIAMRLISSREVPALYVCDQLRLHAFQSQLAPHRDG